MPPRKNTPLNKAFVQNWNVLATYDDTELVCRQFTRRQIAALDAMTEYLRWTTRYDNPPAKNILAEFASETSYNLNHEVDCMDCEELIACLQPLFDDINDQFTALHNQITALQYGYGTTTPPGQNPGSTQNNRNQAEGTNPTCDYNTLWAQCEQLVEWSVTRASDALQMAEAATNSVEAWDTLFNLPLLENTGLATITSYINLLLEGVAEGFEADITETYKAELACELFCEFNVDCQVYIDGCYAVMDRRMRAYFADLPTAFATFGDLVGYMVGAPLDGDKIADAILFIGWGGLKLANAMFDDVGDRPMQLLLALAVNDANSDWELLCTECASCDVYDFKIAADGGYDWLPVANPEHDIVEMFWNDSFGWRRGAAYYNVPSETPPLNVTYTYVQLLSETPRTVKRVNIRINAAAYGTQAPGTVGNCRVHLNGYLVTYQEATFDQIGVQEVRLTFPTAVEASTILIDVGFGWDAGESVTGDGYVEYVEICDG